MSSISVFPIAVGIIFLIYGSKTLIGTKGFQAVSAYCKAVSKEECEYPYGRYFATKIATYEYEYYGQKFTVQVSDPVNKRKMRQGRLCMFFVDPDDPDQYITGPEYRFAVASAVVGGLLIIASPFLC